MEDILKKIGEEKREKLKKEPQPEWVQPMLAKLTHDEFSDKDWIFERKLDGVRCLAFKEGKQVTLMSRNRKNLSNTYPEIVEALKEQTPDKFILDGEIVAFRGDVTSFSELQKRMNLRNSEEIKAHQTEVFFYAFDLIHLDDINISGLQVVDRKSLLTGFVDYKDPIRYTPHRKEKGLDFLQQACLDQWEGLIAKKADSEYSFGRSSNWLKFKCTNQQELVIGGYTAPAGARTGFGALLLGYYENDRLKYAGKVGTGFTDELLRQLNQKLEKLKTSDSPFSNPKEIRSKNVQWVRPELVAQLSFTEWTSGNKLRHPSFLGLREDKNPREVRKED